MTIYKDFLHSILLIIISMVLSFNFVQSSSHFSLYLGVQPRTEFIYTVIKVDSEHLENLFGDSWSSAFIPSGATEEGKRAKMVITDSEFYQENLTAIVKYDYWDFINKEQEFSLVEDKTVLERCHAPEFYTEEISRPFVFTLAHPYRFLPQLSYFEDEEGCWRGVYVNNLAEGKTTDGQIIYEKNTNIQTVCYIDGERVLYNNSFYPNYTLNWVYHDDTGWLKSFHIEQKYGRWLPNNPEFTSCGGWWSRTIYEMTISSNAGDELPNNNLFDNNILSDIDPLVWYSLIAVLISVVAFNVIRRKS